MHSREIEEKKKSLRLSPLQIEVLIGTLLGDAHLESQNQGRTYRLKIEHSIKQKSYVDWLYDVFHEWVITAPQEKTKQLSNGSVHTNYWFSTVSHSAFRFFAHQFYDRKTKKKGTPKLIHRWLTPQAIAVWFMDDGSLKSKFHKARILNTQAFKKGDIRRLMEVLENKFHLQCKMRKQKEGYQIMILGESAESFHDLIAPYMHYSMMYKLKGLG